MSGDKLRVFFALINMITTDSDKKTYIERPVEQVEYSESQLAKRNAQAELINNDLNKIKAQKPSFTRITQKGLPGSDSNQASYILDRVSSIAGAILRLLFGENKNPVDVNKMLESIGISGFFKEQGQQNHPKGADCNDFVAPAGKDYVCNIEGKDIYNENPITKSRHDDSYTFKIYLQDALNPTEDSPHAKVFDLFADEQLYRFVASLAPEIDWSLLNIRYVDCYLEGTVNKFGNVTEYTSHYKCILQIDTSKAGYDINQYIDKINNTELFEYQATYNNFDWSPRERGDVNNDGKITTADARVLLRTALKLEPLTDDILLYGDTNNDGKITSADARTLLRVAMKLEYFPDTKTDETL